MAWTEEQKTDLIAKYLAANPTPDTSIEIIKELSEEFEQSANGCRMILVKAEVYVAKTPGTATAAKPVKEGETAPAGKRVSKESSIASLTAALVAAGAEVDSEILDKLTGKAAVYLTSVINGIASKN